MWAEFLTAIAEGRPAHADFEDGVRANAVIDAIYASGGQRHTDGGRRPDRSTRHCKEPRHDRRSTRPRPAAARRTTGRCRPPARRSSMPGRAAVSPGGVQGEGRSANPYPLFMTRAQGSRIWDVDGNEYVDFHASFGAVLLGHNDAAHQRRGPRAMDEHGVSFSTANPLEVELAERLVEMIPSAERVVFSCTGTEATYHAIRLARGVHRPRADPQVRGQLPRLA